MLDGILYRGFSVKCKALAKATRARIGVVRRRADAKQRLLKDDLAKLLSNGLDINAYGRTEEFIAGKDLLSCYDFIEYSCEYTAKQLSRMQKQGDCPEGCREAVASLMYAAARFSDLPELRELRDIFQQKYGTSLESSANRKFVEKLSSRPPTSEKRLQVLQDIASEFSIKWDYRGFERRMATSAVAQVDVQKADIRKPMPGLLEEKKSRVCDFVEDNILQRDESNHCGKETIVYRAGGSSLQGDGKIILDNSSVRIHDPRKGENTEALFGKKAEFGPGKTENTVSYNCYSQDSKPCSSYAFPPLYVKSKENNTPRPPYTKPKEDGHMHDGEKRLIEPVKVKNGSEKTPLTKPRSIRRKHHRPSSSYNNVVDDALEVGKKDDSGKGLQILFEEKKDDEERMMDKLLIHYCKKPSSNDARKRPSPKKKADGESSLDQKPTRSISLPTEQATTPQPKNIFTRANSFQPEAHHVHPKLPDYDDLAARFAALKGST